MDLLELVKEIDYQTEYSYDKRVELFNKYGISTAQKAFIPIWELAQWIGNRDPQRFISPYSHSAATLSSFNSVFASDPTGNSKNHWVKVRSKGKVIKVFEWKGSCEEFITFRLEPKEITYHQPVTLPRGINIYEEVDKWLIDFGWEAW